MNLRRCWCWLWLLLLSWSVWAREVHLTVLHTCDLHGNLMPADAAERVDASGGLLRCASLIRQIRHEQPNLLLVDAGDTIQGSSLSYQSGGRIMVRALNALRYDAWVWGNHEFDWGTAKLSACAELAAMPILAANVRPSEPAATLPDGSRAILDRLKPFVVREIDGVKIGLIGLTTPGIPTWARPRLIQGLRFDDSVETLKRVLPAARGAGARVLVLVVHQGYRDWGDDHANQINAIARHFPELDAIIGAHSHRDVPEAMVSGVLYCQANYHGTHLGRLDLTFDTGLGRVVRRAGRNLPAEAAVRPDPELLRLFGPEMERDQQYRRQVLGEALEDFWVDGAPQVETPVHNLVCSAIAEALREREVPVDAVLHGVLNERGTLTKGPITMEQVWRLVPFENHIGLAALTPSELREVLDENVAAYSGRWFRGLWGIRYGFDPAAAEGQRVLHLEDSRGRALTGTNRLRVALNSYDLASGGLRWSRLRAVAERPEVHLVEYDLLTREAVIHYIERQGKLRPLTNGWWRAETGQRTPSDP